MKRYRAKKGMRSKVTLRLLFICMGIVVLCVAIGMLSDGADKTMGQAKQTDPVIQKTDPPKTEKTVETIANETVVNLSKSMIQQQGTLVVVNKKRLWPQGYEPDLVDIRDYKTVSSYGLKSNEMRANKSAIMAFDNMMKEAGANGIKNVVITSSYRGYEKQRILFNEKVEELLPQTKNQEQAESIANQTVARPGESEHHTGLAFDLSVSGIAMQQFGDTEQGKWIKAHCAAYGFVPRYLPEKAAFTGIDSEPWHFRYVGVDAAQKMTKNGWCLEEYVVYQP